MPKDKIIEPIDASFDDVVNAVVGPTNKSKEIIGIGKNIGGLVPPPAQGYCERLKEYYVANVLKELAEKDPDDSRIWLWHTDSEGVNTLTERGISEGFRIGDDGMVTHHAMPNGLWICKEGAWRL